MLLLPTERGVAVKIGKVVRVLTVEPVVNPIAIVRAEKTETKTASTNKT